MNALTMLGTHKLVVDTFCELASLFKPYADAEFWDLGQCTEIKDSVLVVSRQTLNGHAEQIKQLADQKFCLPVLVNPTEGSQTMKYQCQRLGLIDLIQSGKLLLVGCGDMEPALPCMWYDAYLGKPYDYPENLVEVHKAKAVYTKLNKPYKFLFLNGRTRAHRKYLIERFDQLGLLDQSLWTNLDTSPVASHTNIYGEICNWPRPIHTLPKNYEVPAFDSAMEKFQLGGFVKNQLFNGLWGEIYLWAEPYIDTYFSVISETVFDYPYSLRSEKIYKPIAIGHPFVAAANCGFYRDLHRAGFKTFGHLIDESFDRIENNQDRLERIITVVQDLCYQNLNEFVVAARDICAYNQLHMSDQAVKIKGSFIDNFRLFVERYKK